VGHVGLLSHEKTASLGADGPGDKFDGGVESVFALLFDPDLERLGGGQQNPWQPDRHGVAPPVEIKDEIGMSAGLTTMIWA
jgi:hypothetical protein